MLICQQVFPICVVFLNFLQIKKIFKFSTSLFVFLFTLSTQDEKSSVSLGNFEVFRPLLAGFLLWNFLIELFSFFPIFATFQNLSVIFTDFPSKKSAY